VDPSSFINRVVVGEPPPTIARGRGGLAAFLNAAAPIYTIVVGQA
jgi:hypothetical protein